MAKNRPKPRDVTERARELKSSGKTRDEVRAVLASEGHKVSAGWVSNACARRSPPPPPSPTSVATSAAPPVAPVADDDAAAGGTDLLPLLARQVRALEELADVARAEGNLAGYATLSRVVNATAALVAKLQPPPPVDPNENPDMIAAAKMARAKLHDLLDRALAEVAA